MAIKKNQEQPTVEDLQAQVDDLTAQLTKATAEAVEGERARAVIRDNPNLLSIYQNAHTASQARKRIEDDRVDLSRDKLAHKKDIEDSDARLRAATIKELAIKHGCDATFLEQLNLETVEQIENVAIALGEAKEGKRVAEPEELALVLDSGESLGGAGVPSEEERLAERYPTMYPG